jgi:hypothetical protein
MRAHLFILLFLIGSSCASEGIVEKYRQAPPFPDTVSVEGEVLPLDLLAPGQVIDTGDYLVAHMGHDSVMVHIFDPSNYELLAKVFYKGRGPREAMGLSLIEQVDRTPGNNAVWLMGMPTLFGKLNIAKSVSEQRAVFDDYYDFTSGAANGMLLKSNMVYHQRNRELWMMIDAQRSGRWNENVNHYYIRYDYDTGIASDTTYLSDFEMPRKEDVPMIQFIAGLNTRSDFKKAVIAWSRMDRFSIVDLESKAITVIGEDGMPARRNVGPAYVKEKYDGLCSTDQVIILLGCDASINNGNSYFDLFDWDGNPIVRILVAEKVMSPEISAKGLLYCITSNEENDRVVRYDISDHL